MNDQHKRPEGLDDTDLDAAQGAGAIIRKISDPDTKTTVIAAMGCSGHEFHGSDFNTAKLTKDQTPD